MKLYLMRHASAKPKGEGSERSLSDEGLREATRVAEFAGRNNTVQVKVVLQSGKLRARQTADIVASSIKPKPRVMDGNGLEPNADPTVWIDRALVMEEDVLLVGHLPHLERLAACLLNRDEEKQSVRFPPAGLVCLSRQDEGKWVVEWKVIPDILV